GNARCILVAVEFYVAAERNCRNLPTRPETIVETDELRAEADGKYYHLDAAAARHQEMPELMEEYDDGQVEQNGNCPVVDGAPATPGSNVCKQLHIVHIPPGAARPDNPDPVYTLRRLCGDFRQHILRQRSCGMVNAERLL